MCCRRPDGGEGGEGPGEATPPPPPRYSFKKRHRRGNTQSMGGDVRGGRASVEGPRLRLGVFFQKRR